ncbi:hypothetical protein J4E83_003606 [Alternaria metachromatica]|uniref:uncharacterized protein n=1 Tax=Alternaria metachromatica TaxID=283354 RepID=UPI0020C4A4F5|nr:uncharacterized protein J4E83_003606 [Alternaria metachromatica]KAI4626455.1 hypothetical protein J4E83_003606 [Alternaria metachromatica]
MEQYQQYATQLKDEEKDDELDNWIPLKQEQDLDERVPTVVPKAGSSGEGTLTSYRRENKRNRFREIHRSTGKRGRRQRDPQRLPKRVYLAEKKRKAAEMSHQPGKKEIRVSQIQQELSDTRKMIAELRARSQAGALNTKPSPPRHEPEAIAVTKQANTIAAIRADITRLEQELKEACRQGENAIRDARAADNNDGDVEALEKELAREQGKDRAMVSKLQKALEKEQDRGGEMFTGSRSVDEQEGGVTGWQGYRGGQSGGVVKVEEDKGEETYTGSRSVCEQEVGMTGWPGSLDLPIRQRVKVEDEVMGFENEE